MTVWWASSRRIRTRRILLFRWRQQDETSDDLPGAELLAVIDGKERRLAADAHGFVPAQWYTLRLNVGWRSVQALIDGQVVLTARNPGAIEGRVLLFAQRPLHLRAPILDDATLEMYGGHKAGDANERAASSLMQNSVCFDDVRTGGWRVISDLPGAERAGSAHARWAVSGNELQARRCPRRKPSDSEPKHRRCSMPKPARRRKQRPGCCRRRDGRIDGYAGRALRPMGKGSTHIAMAPWGAWRGPFHSAHRRQHLGEHVRGSHGAMLKLYCDGRFVLSYYTEGAAGGYCGVWAGGAGVAFRTVSLAPDLRQRTACWCMPALTRING